MIEKNQLTDTIYDFRLQNAELAEITKVGQFAHVYVNGKTLRRPISICSVKDDIIRIVFEVRGEGTEILSQTKKGELVNIIAPLGKGFELDQNKKTVLIGGGIGVPPMLYAAETLGKNAVVINGFRNRKAVILTEDFKKTGCEFIETTDDGSYGIKGFVTQPLLQVINKADMVCACGPMPMLKGIAAIAHENHIPCQISLEQRMACGVGACLGCAVAIRKGENVVYQHVCKDGPVFNAEEVVF